VRELRPARRDIDRHRHGAEPSTAENCFKELETIRANDGNAIAYTNTGRAQRAGKPRGLLACLRIGPRFVAGGDERFLPKPFGLTRQHRRERAIGSRE